MQDALLQTDPQAQGDHHTFNLGNIAFLPKKVAGVDPLWGEFYTAADTRPLVIVNTDNRIIANAFRKRLEPILDTWITAMQQGFLKGRSMLLDVLDISHAAQKTTLNSNTGGIILLGFKAAFPSLSHGFLQSMLEALGLPEHTQAALRNLYCDHRCNINFGGSAHSGFSIDAGIRQGLYCSLSL